MAPRNTWDLTGERDGSKIKTDLRTETEQCDGKSKQTNGLD